ncbi:hypothetical protein [Polycladidibacter hongkongensis]|uniref:hypothetical protein n=1 Tax=Polycladidibacter hongkongensis TaxID=1647556 RepID=UPI000834E287|nr:hypothetical protein [Pseudovibrio hongkongensis]
MKNLLKAAVIGSGLVWTSATAAAPDTGPFGIDMGADPSELPSCKHVEGNRWDCGYFPDKYEHDAYYTLYAHSTTGVCRISYVSKREDVVIAPLITTWLKVAQYKDQISEKYGEPNRSGFLLEEGDQFTDPREVFNKPDIDKDRHFQHEWTDTLKDNLQRIFVYAIWFGDEHGRVAINYTFNNWRACATALEEEE